MRITAVRIKSEDYHLNNLNLESYLELGTVAQLSGLKVDTLKTRPSDYVELDYDEVERKMIAMYQVLGDTVEHEDELEQECDSVGEAPTIFDSTDEAELHSEDAVEPDRVPASTLSQCNEGETESTLEDDDTPLEFIEVTLT